MVSLGTARTNSVTSSPLVSDQNILIVPWPGSRKRSDFAENSVAFSLFYNRMYPADWIRTWRRSISWLALGRTTTFPRKWRPECKSTILSGVLRFWRFCPGATSDAMDQISVQHVELTKI
jgi:hypothetical protein